MHESKSFNKAEIKVTDKFSGYFKIEREEIVNFRENINAFQHS